MNPLDDLFRHFGVTDFNTTQSTSTVTQDERDTLFTKNIPGDNKTTVSVKVRIDGDEGVVKFKTKVNGEFSVAFSPRHYQYKKLKVTVSDGVLVLTMPKKEIKEFDVDVD